MLLTFLSAAVPLAKTISFAPDTGLYTTTAYPMVRKVTSVVEHVGDMFDFYAAVDKHSRAGRALLLGSLIRPLHDESRAGFADKNKLHEWLCFDFDKVDKPPTLQGALDAIAEYLPEEVQDAECVIQLSASCFNPNATKLSCHVFVRLITPVDTKTLKDYLLKINFDGPLKDQIELSESCNALKYKLDPSVTDPSRLIYIATPRLVNFKPKLDEGLAHYEGTTGFTIPHFERVSRERINAEINRQRQAVGLDPRDYKMIKLRGEEVLQNADPAVISDMRASGNHFLRFNLNGGDSLGYYIDLQKPEVIGNFKGEPFLSTKDINESFYKSLIKSTQQLPAQHPQAESLEVMGFYATNRGSALYIGTYDRANDKMRVDRANETAAAAWFRQFGLPLKASYPHYDLVYDISSDIRYEEGYSVINLYQRTDLMKQFGRLEHEASLSTTMALLDERCPITMMFLRSITGDPRSAEFFVNWLAFIFQNRIKTGTAWVLWGTPGSGKGKFLEHVAKPLFGESNVGQVLLSNVDKQFNALLEGKLLVNIDEAAMSRTRDKVEVMSKLSNWITEPFIVINEKNIAEREVPSFVNFIISSNDFRPIALNTGDRRYHVGTRQEKRLLPTPNEFATLVQGEELPAFAECLGRLLVNENMVRNPEMNQQKIRLFEATHSLVDTVAMAVLEGDTSFFFEARPSTVALTASTSGGILPMKQYDDLLRAMVDGTLTVLKHEDLFVLFNVVVNDPKLFPDNTMMQKQLFGRYGLAATERDAYLDKRTGKMEHGIKAPKWRAVPDFMREVLVPKDTSNVTNMRR